MPGRDLKKYDDYMDKIRAYTDACDLVLEYSDVPGDGMYMPSRRKIIIDRDLPESTEIATILHEAGHSTDDTLYSKKSMKAYDLAYKAFYKGGATAEQVDLVVGCETRAWMYARSIAKKLRIPLGKWFDKEESSALADYRGQE